MDCCNFIHSKLIIIREEKKLTQMELSNAINIPQYLISRMENGKIKNPTTPTVCKLSKFFKVSMDYFLGEVEVKRPPKKIKVIY